MRTTHARRALGAALVFCSATPTFAQGDALEPNDIAAQAVPVSAPIFLSDLALAPANGPVGDVDRFSLTLSPGDQISARLLDPGLSTLDPLLLIVDASGVVLARADADAGSSFPRLYFTAPRGGVYQVVATGSGDDTGIGSHAQTGAYGLELQRVPADPHEPNDARAQALFRPALPFALDARLDPADVDWYAFPAAPGAAYVARISAARFLRGQVWIAAFDANGGQLATSPGSATRFAGIEFGLVGGGTVYLAVSGAGDTAFVGQHSLSAPYTITCAERAADRFEPNSTRPTATVLTELPFFASPEFSPGATGDVDWFRFAARRGDQFRLRTSDPGVQRIGTRLGLFRASNGIRVASSSVVSPSDPFSELVFRAGADGDLIAGVSGRSDDDFLGNHNEIGPYDLRIARDAFEPNDEIVQAAPLAAPGSLSDLVMIAGDVDWFRLDLPAGSLWRISTREINGPQPQIAIGLFDGQGRALRRSDGAGGGGLPEILIASATASTYYLGVTGLGDAQFQGVHTIAGGYDLRVEDHSVRLFAVSAPSVGVAGSPIELQGEGFTTERDLAISFGGVPARVLSVPSATRAWVEVPAIGSSAVVGLQLRNLNGASSLANAFQFVAAQPLLAGQSFVGSVASESDWFGFALLEGSLLDLDVRAARTGGLFDARLAVFDPSFQAVDVDSLLTRAGNGSRLRLKRFEIPAGQSGTWYVRLQSTGGVGGAYELRSARKIPAALKRPAPTAGAGNGRSVELGLQVEAGALLSGSAYFAAGAPIQSVELLDAARQPIPGSAEAIQIFAGRGEVKVRSIAMPSFGDAVLVITGPSPEEMLGASFTLKFPKPKGQVSESR
ncbi:MAG: PPC domain-containing protein [Planctomycetes bacterium]|nr:PPC domain-containing protein [Planctomycetota bacterium]